MRIVDRATFLSLPAGTVYAKWRPCCFGEIHIKGDNRGDSDWYSVELSDAPACGDEQIIDVLDRLDSGEEIPVDYGAEYNDGLYELDQRFAIWSAWDVGQLMDRLSAALESAHPGYLQQRFFEGCCSVKP